MSRSATKHLAFKKTDISCILPLFLVAIVWIGHKIKNVKKIFLVSKIIIRRKAIQSPRRAYPSN